MFEPLCAALDAAGIAYAHNEPLADHCTFRIGGPADLFVRPETEEQLCTGIALCKEQGVRCYLLGNGSNILFEDAGFRGAVIDLTALKTGIGMKEEPSGECSVTVGAGTKLSTLCIFAHNHSCAGLEFAYGIPGTVGGAVYMNAGAYGGEIRQVCKQVEVMNRQGQRRVLTAEEMGFSYRHSVLEETGDIVLSAEFTLTPAEPEIIRGKMKELIGKRTASQPLDLPSAGSAFKRPVGGYAAALIEQAGLKGFRLGNAGISEKHAGFAVNLGGATAGEMRQLLQTVSDRVYETSGIRLEPEIRIWNP